MPDFWFLTHYLSALDIKLFMFLLYNFRINPRLSPLFCIPKLSCCKLHSSTRQSRAGGVDWRLQGTQPHRQLNHWSIRSSNRTERRQSQKAASKEIDSGIDHKWTEAMVRGGWAGAQEAQKAGQVVAGIAMHYWTFWMKPTGSGKRQQKQQQQVAGALRQEASCNLHSARHWGGVASGERGSEGEGLWWPSIRSSIHTAGSLSRRWRWSLPRSCPAIT